MNDCSLYDNEKQFEVVSRVTMVLLNYVPIEDCRRSPKVALEVYNLPAAKGGSKSGGPTYIRLDAEGHWTSSSTRVQYDALSPDDVVTLDDEEARRLKALVALGLLAQSDVAVFTSWLVRARDRLDRNRTIETLRKDAAQYGFELTPVKVVEKVKASVKPSKRAGR